MSDTANSAFEALQKWQRQLDPEGVEVGVSRQALDEVLVEYEQLRAQLDECRLAKAREGKAEAFS